MKNVKMLILVMLSMVTAINAVDYAKGEFDADGRGMWHIIAANCATNDSETQNYMLQLDESYLKNLDDNKEDIKEKMLEAFYKKDKHGQTAFDIVRKEAKKSRNLSAAINCYKMYNAMKKIEYSDFAKSKALKSHK